MGSKENGVRKVLAMWKVRTSLLTCWERGFQMTPEFYEHFVPFDLFAGDPLNVPRRVDLHPHAESPRWPHGRFLRRFCLCCDARRTQNRPQNLPGRDAVCRGLCLRSSRWREWALPKGSNKARPWPPFGAELYFWLHRPPSGRQHWGQKSQGRHPGHLEGSGSARQWIYDRLHPRWASISLERKQTHKRDAVWWAARMKLTDRMGCVLISSVRQELNSLLFPHRPAGQDAVWYHCNTPLGWRDRARITGPSDLLQRRR